MSLSPGSILAKLGELQKWQNQQQERLLEQHHKQLENSTAIETVRKTKPKENNSIITINAKPKQPFLRRGAGLSRFRMTPGEQFKPFVSNNTKLKTPPQRSQPPQKPNGVLPKAVWENPSLNDTERELALFETLEQRASNSSFCSTNSSIIRLLSTSTPSKNTSQQEEKEEKQNDVQDDYEKKMHDDYLNLIERAVKVTKYMDTDLTPSSSLTSVNKNDSYNDKTKWDYEPGGTTDTSASSIFSEENTLAEEQEEDTKCDAETMTDLFIEPVNKLECELKEARAENLKNKKFKEQLEQKTKEFEKYKKETMKYIEEEKIRTNSLLEEEKKKSAKDKMVFERYGKDLQNKPNRKEREEITALKLEVTSLKETLKLKETRHGTTLARFRNQVKSLEKKISTLKLEIDNLNKQHAKEIATQRLNAQPTNTKMMHIINKNLSKLTQEHFKKFVKIKESSSEDEEEEYDDDEEENDKNFTNKIRQSIDDVYKQTFDEKPKQSDRTEHILSDGTKQIKYTNGNIKNVSSDGNIIIFQYFNGDVKETNLLEGTIRYHHFDTKINQTTNADGSELIQFPDGQIEYRLKNGTCEIEYPNGIRRKILVNGDEETVYPDGTIVNTLSDKRIISLPNGQKEIHTNDHKRREYPDGTVKLLYPDGKQETRYANGRVRLKDKDGNLIMDSQQ